MSDFWSYLPVSGTAGMEGRRGKKDRPSNHLLQDALLSRRLHLCRCICHVHVARVCSIEEGRSIEQRVEGIDKSVFEALGG